MGSEGNTNRVSTSVGSYRRMTRYARVIGVVVFAQKTPSRLLTFGRFCYSAVGQRTLMESRLSLTMLICRDQIIAQNHFNLMPLFAMLSMIRRGNLCKDELRLSVRTSWRSKVHLQTAHSPGSVHINIGIPHYFQESLIRPK